MRAASPAVIALLATGKYVTADLWTITLVGGGVVRWTSADRTIKYGGVMWAKGPVITREAIGERRGPDVATLQMTISALDIDLIGGSPAIQVIAAHGLDGASVKLEKAYAPDWASMLSGPTGTAVRFAGKVTSVNSVQGITAEITISSWMILLGVNMPRNLYQAACVHTLFDPGCSLSAAAFAVNGHVTASEDPGVPSFPTDIIAVDNYYALGRMVVTSGANSGLTRTIKTSNSGGVFGIVRPFPHAFANGDTITVYPGCDLTRPTCLNKFSNLNNYKGTDFVPLPQTPISTPASSTTSSSGKGGSE